jgi:hypothetical protein
VKDTDENRAIRLGELVKWKRSRYIVISSVQRTLDDLEFTERRLPAKASMGRAFAMKYTFAQ